MLILCATTLSAAPSRKQKTIGNILAWGYNGYGNLCNGTSNNASTPTPVNNFPGVMALAASLGHTLALTSDGTVWACGANGNGSLGTGSSSSYLSSFAQVSNLTGVVAIAAADNGTNSFALKSDGTVWAWGTNNRYGVLGNGTTTASTVPVEVSGLSSVTAISVDPEGNNAMALESNGTVWAWGYNGDGELGNAGINNSSTPVQVSNLAGVVAVAMGTYNGYALESNGTVWAWGINNYGELGSGTTAVDSNVPVQVTGLSGIIAIAGSPIPGGSGGGGSALALRSDGTVWAWGYNGLGQLGNGTTGGSSSMPVEVSNLTGVTAIASGGETGMALESNGTLWVWGSGNNGELGLGSTTLLSLSPVQVTSLSGIAAITAGPDDDLALQSEAIGQAWGDNVVGELGNGTTGSESTGYDVPTPGAVEDLSGLIAISAGGGYSLALRSDGTVWAWGDNAFGELGNGTTTNSNVPVQVSNLSGIVAVAAGGDQALALQSDGTVWAWGCNSYSGLSSCSGYSATPSQVSGVIDVVAIAGGGLHNLALESDGTVWAWGYNLYGELGNGTTTASSSPVQVVGLSNVVAIAGGYYHSLAVRSDGTLWAWGDNEYGELGNSATLNSYSDSPVQVLDASGSAFSGVVAVTGGFVHSVALKGDGTVWAWGDSTQDELGNRAANGAAPVPVQDGVGNTFSGVEAISTGFAAFNLALRSDGTVWAWGNGGSGQLGNGLFSNSFPPVEVCDLSGASAVAAGGDFSLALTLPSTSQPLCISAATNATVEVGQTVSLLVTTIGSPTPSLTETGTLPMGLTFLDNGNGTGTLSGTVATGTVGVYNITFTAQNGVAPNGIQNATLTVTQAATSISLAASPNPANSGQTVTLTGTLAVTPPGSGTPTGTVTFLDGGAVIGSAALASSGTAVFTTSSLAVGSHNLTASYNGDSNFTGSTAAAVSLTVNMAAPPPTNGSVWFWGNYAYSPGLYSSSPALVNTISNVVAVAAGTDHSLALSNSGAVWAWGGNGYGQLGNGTACCVGSPGSESFIGGTEIPVMVTSGMTAIAAGQDDSLSLDSSGVVWAWGSNLFGELGNGTTTQSDTPGAVLGPGGSGFLTGITAIAAGALHSLAVRSDGTVWAWGYNGDGELGNGTNTDSATPVQISSISSISAVAGGTGHSLALTSGGTVWAWGENSDGELGNGTNTGSNTPVQVSGLAGITAISAGGDFSLALKSDGTVWAWGDNQYGELGNGGNSNSSTPTQVSGLTGITAIAAGFEHGLALKSDGTVWAWGDNSDGELGNGTTASSSTPIEVTAPCGVGLSALAAGQYYSLALALPASNSAPCITSPNAAAFFEGQAGSFTVTATGTPTPSFTESGSLPSGVTFVDNGNGTGTLSGTAAAGTGGTYSIAIAAQNGVTPNSTQAFKLNIVVLSSSGSSGSTSEGSTGNGGNGTDTSSCNCNVSQPASYVNPNSANPSQTSAPILAISVVASGTISTGINEGTIISGLVTVTTSTPSGILASQVASANAGIPTGLPVVGIKGLTGASSVYDGSFQVVSLIDSTHYQVQNLGAIGAAPLSGGTSGTSVVTADPLESPGGKYTVTANIDNTNQTTSLMVTRNSDSVVVYPQQNFPITTNWGFSPDDDRFFIEYRPANGISNGTYCMDNLYVYDLSVSPARQVVYSAIPVWADLLRFSPSGTYLLYAANEYAAGCPANGDSSTALPDYVNLAIYRVKGVTSQDMVYQTQYTFTPGVVTSGDYQYGPDMDMPGTIEEDLDLNDFALFGGTDWGFSPDNPETSFVFAYANSANTLQWELINLAKGKQVQGYTTVPTTTTLAPDGTTTLEAFWQFDTCGDVVALVMPGQAQNQSEVTFYDTGSGAQLTSESVSASVLSITLATTPAGQEITYGSVTQVAVPSTCGQTNTPTGQNVVVQPTDMGTSTAPITVTFSNVVAGETTVTSTSTAPSPATPDDFQLGNPAVYYDVSTTAQLATPPQPPMITICIDYGGFSYTNPSAVQLYHYQNGSWVNVTTSNNTTTTTACGSVSSLSPFALFEPTVVPSGVAATSGTPQSAAISTAFPNPLQVTVTDSNGNPLSGIPVTFVAPVVGPTGTFSGSSQAVVTSNSSGIVTAPRFTGNGAAGSYTVTATVNGLAAAANFSLTNLKGSSSVQLTTSATGPVVYGTPVTLSATVTSAMGTPTGTVNFLNGSASLGMATLSQSGVAALTTSALPSGNDNITAVYGGDPNFAGSTSAVETVSVNAADYAFGASETSVSLAAGQSTNPPITITVTPEGFSGTVTVSCGTLPAYITCAFNPSGGALTFSSGATAAQSLTLTIAVASTVSLLQQTRSFTLAMILPITLAGFLPIAGKNRKRLRLFLGIVVLTLAAAGLIAGCAGGGNSTASNLPPAGAQNVTVTATGSGNISHQVQLTVTIAN